MMETKTAQSTYTKAATALFNTKIAPNFFKLTEGNIWRAAWAYNNILDYFNNVDRNGSDQFAINIINQSFVATGGDWWDDFGWTGIASITALETQTLNSNDQAKFLETAINCWCFMYGPKWSKTGATEPYVPFPNFNQWNKKTDNIGARAVYDEWEKKGMPSYWAQLEPRFTPGGLWNNTGAPAQPVSLPNACGYVQELNGLQNTVTNGLFLLLSIRLLKLSGSGNYAPIFANSNMDLDKLRQATTDQLNWFSAWFEQNGTGSSSLSYSINALDPNSEILIRERVPQLHNGNWSAGYCPELAWLGDQGILFAAFREFGAHNGSLNLSVNPRLQGQVGNWFKAIQAGVARSAWSEAGYPNANTNVLRPWVQYKFSPLGGTYASFPAGDDDDYKTGVGVYCNFLMSALKNGYQISSTEKQRIISLADLILTGYFDKLEPTICDAFILSPGDGRPANLITAHINCLAILTLAAKLT